MNNAISVKEATQGVKLAKERLRVLEREERRATRALRKLWRYQDAPAHQARLADRLVEECDAAAFAARENLKEAEKVLFAARVLAKKEAR